MLSLSKFSKHQQMWTRATASKTSGISSRQHLFFYQVHAAKHCIQYSQNFIHSRYKKDKLTPLQIKAHQHIKSKQASRLYHSFLSLTHSHIPLREWWPTVVESTTLGKAIWENSHWPFYFISAFLLCTVIFSVMLRLLVKLLHLHHSNTKWKNA